MTEDAIYSKLMDILAAIGSVNTKIAGIEGRLVAGDLSMSDLKIKLDARPCMSQGLCPTTQVPLPPAPAIPQPSAELPNSGGAADAIKAFLSVWNSIPHAYRIGIVATIGGVGAVQAQHILDWISRLSQ